LASDARGTGAARGGFVSACATAISTGFGAGYSPLVPGTAGSAVGLASFWAVHALPPFHQVAATLLLFVLGVFASSHTASRVGLKDPGIVVVDEIMGQWTTLLLLPLTPLVALLGFLLFRALDIVKPYPARDLERLPGGLGIMADDLMAGIYANLLLRIGLIVVPAT
jgi:phosphatidylglycerophosphatase A